MDRPRHYGLANCQCGYCNSRRARAARGIDEPPMPDWIGWIWRHADGPYLVRCAQLELFMADR